MTGDKIIYNVILWRSLECRVNIALSNIVSYNQDARPAIDDAVREIIGLNVFDDSLIFGSWLKPQSGDGKFFCLFQDRKGDLKADF